MRVKYSLSKGRRVIIHYLWVISKITLEFLMVKGKFQGKVWVNFLLASNNHLGFLLLRRITAAEYNQLLTMLNQFVVFYILFLYKDQLLSLVRNVGDTTPTCHEMPVLLVNFVKRVSLCDT